MSEKTHRPEEAAEFVMDFVASSERYRSQYVDRWREVMANFLVEPEWVPYRNQDDPYRRTVYKSPRNRVILKDPETHKVVMTYVAKLAKALFGDPRREYVQASPSGYEDVQKAQSATRLLRYAFALPGHYRTFVEALTDVMVFGTSIIETYWKSTERTIPVRTLTTREGIEESFFERVTMPVYEDVCLRCIDIEDFYPDPSRYRMEEMTGAAKRFKMNGFEAQRMTDSGSYDKDAVKSALAGGSSDSQNPRGSFRQGLDQPTDRPVPAEFKERTGYEYWGDTPWGWRLITVFNKQVVRDKDWPLADPYVPFTALGINPIVGRFYNLSPAEVIRWDQSFADAMKILLAEAAIRQVHPPIAFDDAGDVDIKSLKEWKADAPIAIRGGPNSIGTLQYGANVGTGFSMLSMLKDSMQGASGAQGAIEGEPGPAREAATVGARRYEMALDRPELAARLIEEDALPMIGRAILRRYQQFLENSDDLKSRIGEMPEPVWIGDIQGDFDVSFVGSRMAMTRQQKLQGIDRLVPYVQAIPAAQLALPSIDLVEWIVGQLLELPEIASKIGSAEVMQANAAAMGAFPPRAGAPAAAPGEPPGLLPAQASGGGP